MIVDHVGVAVKSIDSVLPFYQQALGLVVAHREDVASQKVRVVFLKDPSDSGQGAQIELLEPMAGDGPVGKFVQTHGVGMHHVAFRAADIQQAMRRLKEQGRSPLEDSPRPGSRGHRVCFLHPRSAEGVLVELVES